MADGYSPPVLLSNEPQSSVDTAAIRASLDLEKMELTKISQEMARLRLQYQNTQNSIEQKYKLLSPIRTVPPEILVEIFLYFCHSLAQRLGETGNRHFCPQLLIASVCRRWREVAFAAPSLWTHFRLYFTQNNRDQEQLMPCDRWLSSSGSGPPLSMEIYAEDHDAKTLPGLREMLPLLSNEFYRCSSLELIFNEPEWEEALVKLGPCDFPSLKHIEVQIGRQSETVPPELPTPTDASHACLEWAASIVHRTPNLQTLHWFHLTRYLDPPSLPTQITSLTLGSLYHSRCEEVEVLRILKHTPALERLILDITAEGSTPTPNDLHIVLPHVNYLLIQFNDEVTNFLNHLTLPALAHLSINTGVLGIGPYHTLPPLYARSRFPLQWLDVEVSAREERLPPLLEFFSNVGPTLKCLETASPRRDARPLTAYIQHILTAFQHNALPLLDLFSFSVWLDDSEQEELFREILGDLFKADLEGDECTAKHLRKLQVDFLVGHALYSLPSTIKAVVEASFAEELERLKKRDITVSWEVHHH